MVVTLTQQNYFITQELNVYGVPTAPVRSRRQCPYRTQAQVVQSKCLKTKEIRDPWVAQQFGVCLGPRAQPWGPGIESPVGLPEWSLLLPPHVSLPLSISVSIMNK